ncbi:MAG: TolC family protein [Verrucomicrobiota bacterium]
MNLKRATLILCSLALGLAGCARYQPKPLSVRDTAERLESRTLDHPELRKILEQTLHRAFAVWPPQVWDFPSLEAAAYFYHPSLAVARAQWRVAKAGVITAGARPNPTIGVTPEYNFNPASGVSPWIATLPLDIPIETAGKRGYRVARAQHRSVAAHLNIATVAWQVRSNLRAALLDFTDATRREKLLQAQQAIQEEAGRRLEQKLRAGAIETLELSRARLALARSRVEAGEARRQASEALARVAEAIGVPLGALQGVVIAEDWKRPAETNLTTDQARRQALQSRPDVLAALADYDASQSALQHEIAKQYPNIHLGTGYQFDQGENKWALGVTAEIPVLNRNQGPIAEAQARRTEAAARFLSVQSKAMAEMDRALAVYRNAQERLDSLAALRAALQQPAASFAAQVQAGAAEPLDLLAVRTEQAATELLEWDARVQLVRSFGQLEEAIQCPLGISGAIESPPNAAVTHPPP